MNYKELDNYKISDLVKFHDVLNPKLWIGITLRPEVKKQLRLIAEDFLDELGINGLDVKDIIIAGSNAAYSYTRHSDLDLHILVDMDKLPNDEIYRELFTAKKTIYNDSHNIKVHGVPVELYVQDINIPLISLGEYSILNDKWNRLPSKRRANFDQTATSAKFDKLSEIIKYALKSQKLSTVNKVIEKIKKYRKAGLEKGGEFSPENLAYKLLRNKNYINKLYDLRDRLHSEELTIETMYQPIKDKNTIDKPILMVNTLAEKHGVSVNHIKKQLEKGIDIEKEHTTYLQTARELALDHLADDPDYYTKSKKENLEEKEDELPEKVYHIINSKNLSGVLKKGLLSKKNIGIEPAVYCFPDKNSIKNAVMNLLDGEFDEDDELALLEIDTSGLSGKYNKGAEYEITITEKIPPSKIKVLSKNLATPINESIRTRSNLPTQLFVSKKKLTNESFKPDAELWTSTAIKTSRGYTSEWIEWCKSEMPEWVGDEGILYDVRSGAKILDIGSDKDAMDIARQYGIDVKDPMELFTKMRWSEIEKDYDAIHHVPKGNNIFMGTWDVESTAWLNKTYLTNPRKVKIDSNTNIAYEDYDPNGPPPGPEFKPTMPKGTVRVDVSDVYDWYKLGQHISNMKGLGKHDFGKGPPSTILSFGDEDTEHDYIDYLKKTGLDTTDIDPKAHDKKKGQKVDPTYNVNEAFDQPYPIQWEESDYGDVDALAKLDDGTYLSIMFNNSGMDSWNVEFHRNNSQEITGEGDALRIFATVLSAIQQFIQEYNPHIVYFSVVKDQDPKGSRAKLYDRLVQRYASQLGYAVKRITRDDEVGYNLVRIQKVEEASENNLAIFYRGEPILTPDRLEQLKSSIGKPYPILRKEGSAANIGTYMSPDGDKATSFVKQALAGQGKGGTVTKIAVDPNSFQNGDGGIDEAVIITNIAGLVSDKEPDEKDPLRINDRKQAMLKYLGPGVKKYLNDPLLSNPLFVEKWYDPEFAQKNWNTIKSGKQAVTKPGESQIQERMMKLLGPLADEIRRDPEVIEYFLTHNPGDWVEYNFRMNSDGSGTKVLDVKYYPPVTKESASGYIPSYAEKNDPRFKTALTVDVRPYTMKKDAKKFGNKISRAGIPPTLKASGKF